MERSAGSPIPKDPREVFVKEVIEPLDVSDEIVEAFTQVDRAEFAPVEFRELAYTDSVITIGKQSSISQPSLVAIMLEKLDLRGDETVLEIGTATGYQASLLSILAKEVHTIEVNPELSKQAKNNIQRLGYNNVTVHTGDGAEGIPDKIFDRIIITAAIREVPAKLVSQLADGGIIVAPMGESYKSSRLTVFTKSGEELIPKTSMACTFVPLVTETSAGWSEKEIAARRLDSIAMHRQPLREQLEEMAKINGVTFDVLMDSIRFDLEIVLKSAKTLSDDQVIDAFSVVLFTLTQLGREDGLNEVE